MCHLHKLTAHYWKQRRGLEKEEGPSSSSCVGNLGTNDSRGQGTLPSLCFLVGGLGSRAKLPLATSTTGLLHICVQVEQQEGPWPRAASKGQGPRLLGEHALARSFQRELLHGPWHLVEVLLIRVGLLGIDPLTGRGFDCCVDQGLLRIL